MFLFLNYIKGIIIYILAVIGQQIFGDNYVKNIHIWSGELPRWHFVDFDSKNWSETSSRLPEENQNFFFEE